MCVLYREKFVSVKDQNIISRAQTYEIILDFSPQTNIFLFHAFLYNSGIFSDQSAIFKNTSK